MKAILLIFIFFLTRMLSVPAQTLYGVTSNSINKFIPATNTLTVAKSLDGSFAEHPSYTNLIKAADGKLYGMTSQGGTNSGVIFSFDPTSSTYTKLKDFNYLDGAGPNGSLMQAGDGKFYGMTLSGGSIGVGVIFSFDPVTAAYTKLHDFDNANGAQPNGSLIQANNGKLYGMTNRGGISDNGIIFSFDPSSATFTKLKDFNLGYPYGSLTQATNGKLYGMTSLGKNTGLNEPGNGAGFIFSFDPASNIYTPLKDFDGISGASPYGSLIQASNGKLYGTTPQGGSSITSGNYGVLFSFDPSTSTYTKLVDFDISKGTTPLGDLFQASDGKLYGMTRTGGSIDDGVLFSFDPATSIYTRLRDFDHINGARPESGLVQAGNGKLYGMTNQGGSYGVTTTDNGLGETIGVGVIFSFDPPASTYTKLKDFGISEEGATPRGDLVQASNGKLYGMTTSGGKGFGVIYSFDPATSAYSKLKDLDLATGGTPTGNLTQAGDGKLYGLTSYGGSSINRYGVIFSFDPSNNAYTKLKDFDDPEGGYPDGGLTLASDGKLYGMATGGFTTGPGAQAGFIFSFDPGSSIYTKLKDFDFTDGAHPRGNLLQAADGKLYGMTQWGGTNNSGVIFSFDPLTSAYAKLKDFDGTDGAFPVGNLVQATNGKLYGVTYSGGSIGADAGVLFSFESSTSTFTNLKDFDYTNGAYGINLMQASDGKLYGTTVRGGLNDMGVVFSFDLARSVYTKLQDLNGTNGQYAGGTFIELRECSTSKTYYRDADGDGYGNPAIHVKACTKPAGYVTNNGDCDDTNKNAHGPVTYYRDADGDGYGDGFVKKLVCSSTPPPGYVKNDYDCDDHRKAALACNERVRMCHNGTLECVYAKDIHKKLCLGWTLGLCPANCNNGSARLTTIASKNIEAALPEVYKLSSYPNPFAGQSTIQYDLPFDSKVSIKVYDPLGRTVAVLVNEDKKAGSYTVNFNAGRLSSGSLYYRIVAKSKEQQFEQTNSMILVK